MTAKDGFLGIVDKVLIDIEDVKGRFPGTFAKQKNDTAAGVGDFEFRPLTEEEKKEFVNSLDAQRQAAFVGAWTKAKFTCSAAASRERRPLAYPLRFEIRHRLLACR